MWRCILKYPGISHRHYKWTDQHYFSQFLWDIYLQIKKSLRKYWGKNILIWTSSRFPAICLAYGEWWVCFSYIFKRKQKQRNVKAGNLYWLSTACDIIIVSHLFLLTLHRSSCLSPNLKWWLWGSEKEDSTANLTEEIPLRFTPKPSGLWGFHSFPFSCPKRPL